MGHTPAVAFDSGFLLETGEGGGTIELWQGAVHEPPGAGADGNYEDGEDPEEDPKNGSQEGSRTI